MLRNPTLLEDHEREESDENECEGPEFRRRILCLHHVVKEILLEKNVRIGQTERATIAGGR